MVLKGLSCYGLVILGADRQHHAQFSKAQSRALDVEERFSRLAALPKLDA